MYIYIYIYIHTYIYIYIHIYIAILSQAISAQASVGEPPPRGDRGETATGAMGRPRRAAAVLALGAALGAALAAEDGRAAAERPAAERPERRSPPRVPPMGWSSWYAFGQGVTQAKVEATYRQLVNRSVVPGANRVPCCFITE